MVKEDGGPLDLFMDDGPGEVEDVWSEPGKGDDLHVSERFVRAFSSFSYENQDYALATFHMIVGQLLKNQRILKGGSKLDTRISTFAMWGPSGGKSAALDMVAHVAEQTGLKFQSVSEFTDAALLGTIEEKREGKEVYYETQPGFLGQCDIMHSDEATMLFKDSTHSQNTKNHLQQALNPIGSRQNVIRKKLAHGEWITVKPHCSLYLTSFLPTTFEEAVMGTGFFQRILVVPKRLTIEQRRGNSMRDIELLGTDSPAMDTGAVIAALRKLKETYAAEQEWDFSEVKPRLRNCVDRYYSLMNSINSTSAELISGFVPRYQNMLYVLALHNAALRGDTCIAAEDVNRGHALVYDLLRRIVTLVETKTEVGKHGAREDKRVEAAIIQALNKRADKDGWAGIQLIISEVQRLWRVSPATASEMVNNQLGGILEEKRVGPARFVRYAERRNVRPLKGRNVAAHE